MKIVLICHKDSLLSYQGISAWLNHSFELVGVIVIEEKQSRKMDRIRKEMKRSGFWGLIDVFLFRFYYRFFWSGEDKKIEQSILDQVHQKYGTVDWEAIDTVSVTTPNSKESEDFLKSKSPDFVIARCKFLLRERIFSIPRLGTYVFHPGICPEYRNAHGCHWAIMNRDYNTVGMTMLKIDKGIDTGPVYGYFSYGFDAENESHITIQSRVVFDNLEEIASKMKEIEEGTAIPLTIEKNRKSGIWGQPRFTRYLRWKMNKKLPVKS